MCPSRETVITVVYHADSKACDAWVTESDDSGQMEIVSFVAGLSSRTLSAFEQVRNHLVHDGFIGAIGTTED